MPTWHAVIVGIILSAIAAAVAVRFVLRERNPSVLLTAALAALAAPLAWDLVLRHTGGDFFVDAPGLIFPISFEDLGSGVFTVALAALLLGLGPQRTSSGQRVSVTAGVCGASALLVDIYLY